MSAMIAPAGRLQGSTGSSVGRTSSGNFRDIVPKGYKISQLNRFTPEQQQLFGDLFSHLSPRDLCLRRQEEKVSNSKIWMSNPGEIFRGGWEN